MQYVGSKNRIAKELAPIIQSYIDSNTSYYIEPFVGGANMIDKIKCNRRVGFDIHEELIELLKYSQNTDNEIPNSISEEEYIRVKNNRANYPKWYVGLVGFCGSFGAKYFGGFARRYKKDGEIEDVPAQAIRSLERQRGGLDSITFIHSNFKDIDSKYLKNAVIYCDIPYRDTTKYSTNSFQYDDFYDWCIEVAKDNVVLVSEYSMPDEFECIWEKEHKTSLGSGINDAGHQKRVEKLFIVKTKK